MTPYKLKVYDWHGLKLESRTIFCFKCANIKNLDQLLCHTEKEILKLPELGKKSWLRLLKELEAHGFSLKKEDGA